MPSEYAYCSMSLLIGFTRRYTTSSLTLHLVLNSPGVINYDLKNVAQECTLINMELSDETDLSQFYRPDTLCRALCVTVPAACGKKLRTEINT